MHPSHVLRLVARTTGACFAFLWLRLTQAGIGVMSYRRFKGADGGTWEAWEVHPLAIERRLSVERRRAARGAPDRRKLGDVRLAIPQELSGGWLTVEGAATKVRVAPIPEGWMALTDEQLIALARRAAR